LKAQAKEREAKRLHQKDGVEDERATSAEATRITVRMRSHLPLSPISTRSPEETGRLYQQYQRHDHENYGARRLRVEDLVRTLD